MRWRSTCQGAGAECYALESAFPALHQVAGNIARPGFTAPKLLRVRRHGAEYFCPHRPETVSNLGGLSAIDRVRQSGGAHGNMTPTGATV